MFGLRKKISNLTDGLKRTRQHLSAGIGNVVLGKKEIDADLLDDIETQLLMADVGAAATKKIIAHLTDAISRKQLNNAEALMDMLKQQLQTILQPRTKPLEMTDHKPFVILMVGVNGAGKTTTIGKLAHQLKAQNKKVMLAAGDTFRAAAIEQLQAWGDRNDVPVIAQHTGADSASVIFDAMQSAKVKGIDVLIADTAGRLQNKEHLMTELQKVKRVLAKHDETAPHEVMLVLDAGTGQNALKQAQVFSEAVNVSGITLTKLDGTAKGGIVFAIANQLDIPIRFIGVGEAVEDLKVFNGQTFVEALFQ